MEWTKEQRYRSMDDVTGEELAGLAELVNQCPWRQSFHIQPETGLLNDPNGFSYYNGEYHMFYQWFPLGPVHGLKHWYHTKSKDLVHWENVGMAIKPSQEFDSHGAYSGSGIEHEGKLFLMYTGNTRNENWVRHPYQCMAVMSQDGSMAKMDAPVIAEVPKGYTDHFRDPKVWKDGDRFFAVIGAQRENETGTVVLYHSQDLKDWQFAGEIKTGLGEHFGYMWECPDYFELEGQGVLLFSPQGLKAEDDSYQNIYQSGYVIGSPLDMEKAELKHGAFHELDRGFDFYAPQTMQDPQGRRILVGWMGLPEIDYPTDKNGWAHCLTLPRELSIKGGKLLQQPVAELEALRGEKAEASRTVEDETVGLEGFEGEVYELLAEFSGSTADEFGLELRVGESQKTVIKYDAVTKKVVFDRTHSGASFAEEFGTVRKCGLDAEKISFRIFVDVSSIEVFVNNGEEVFTGRIFPSETSNGIRVFARGGATNVEAVKWDIIKP
ncbi:sucrose-6-phosphate hydrolase [Bacillus sp. ISL-47]|uniref:glycoside hydrolase family 32 protein n=1 Tax=Bacillus sp. ISL-47 TaxID=2819130 RepID=UPI001BEB044E|nr:sucrose-6-phosphate hydrolase [Bacillus sp. ISL-47]MBT2690847.1 sucrose-6-phosphate hydrolase [Bacillus sp. ISL-47]MBT2710794.1 sucrose-6-phosphate hydrolase [Pseudomonas sp. ISL-84]